MAMEIITAQRFKDLKKTVEEICQKRSLDTPTYVINPSCDGPIRQEHFTNIAKPLASINTISDSNGNSINDPKNGDRIILENEIVLLELKAAYYNGIKADADESGCGAICTGLCQGYCSSGCSGGCKNDCAISCHNGCGTGCGSCGTECTANCVGGCSDVCKGCGSGCASTCIGGCGMDCSGGCLNGCGDGCTGECGDGGYTGHYH